MTKASLILAISVLLVSANTHAKCVPSTTNACTIEFEFSWDASPGATRYDYRWRTEGQKFQPTQQTEALKVPFSHEMKVGEKLQATVRACRDSSCSDWAWISLVFDWVPPQKPKNLRLRILGP